MPCASIQLPAQTTGLSFRWHQFIPFVFFYRSLQCCVDNNSPCPSFKGQTKMYSRTWRRHLAWRQRRHLRLSHTWRRLHRTSGKQLIKLPLGTTLATRPGLRPVAVRRSYKGVLLVCSYYNLWLFSRLNPALSLFRVRNGQWLKIVVIGRNILSSSDSPSVDYSLA
jgi:hypothetical protein